MWVTLCYSRFSDDTTIYQRTILNSNVAREVNEVTKRSPSHRDTRVPGTQWRASATDCSVTQPEMKLSFKCNLFGRAPSQCLLDINITMKPKSYSDAHFVNSIPKCIQFVFAFKKLYLDTSIQTHTHTHSPAHHRHICKSIFKKKLMISFVE